MFLDAPASVFISRYSYISLKFHHQLSHLSSSGIHFDFYWHAGWYQAGGLGASSTESPSLLHVLSKTYLGDITTIELQGDEYWFPHDITHQGLAVLSILYRSLVNATIQEKHYM